MRENFNFSGIYCFENIVNGKRYIGQGLNIARRKNSHFYLLKKGTNECTEFQNAWNEFGKNAFIFYVLNETANDQELLNKMEIFYIKYLHSHISENGYNMTWGGGSYLKGRIVSEETREKFSKLAKGRKLTDEQIEKQRKSNTGSTRTPEQKRIMSEAKVGEKNPMYGVDFSEEHRQHLSESHKGEKHWAYGLEMSEEKKEEMRFAKQGLRGEGDFSSKYVGVSYDKTRGPAHQWRSAIMYQGKTIHLGRFPTQEEAALAYNKKAIEIYGNMAVINIIK